MGCNSTVFSPRHSLPDHSAHSHCPHAHSHRRLQCLRWLDPGKRHDIDRRDKVQQLQEILLFCWFDWSRTHVQLLRYNVAHVWWSTFSSSLKIYYFPFFQWIMWIPVSELQRFVFSHSDPSNSKPVNFLFLSVDLVIYESLWQVTKWHKIILTHICDSKHCGFGCHMNHWRW